MPRNQERNRAAILVAGVLLALVPTIAVVAVAAQANRGSTAAPVLPDLDQETPTDLRVRSSGRSDSRSYRLGFRSAVENVGAGPLVVRGRRWGPSMTAEQIVKRVDGSETAVRNVGSIQYVESPDHRHWHYLGFERYELRRVGSEKAIVRDRKSGFCLGDRYHADVSLPGAPADQVYTRRCGLGARDLTEIEEGISVGYGDSYSAFLEYQDLPLDDLPSGRYLLVHHVNADRRLHELSYENNSASVLLELRWRGGKPFLKVLGRCPDSASCTAARSRRK